MQLKQSINNNKTENQKPPVQIGASTVKATPIVQVSVSSNKNAITNNEKHDDNDDVRSGKDESARPKTSVVRFQNQEPIKSANPPPSQSNQVQQESEQYGQKDLTPKERMILNKLKKADQEAARVR